MHHSGGPSVVISGIGVVSPFGIGRERFWDHVRRGCSGTRAITDFDASGFGCRVAAPVTHVTVDDVPALDGDDIWDPGYRADPKRYSRAALVGVMLLHGGKVDERVVVPADWVTRCITPVVSGDEVRLARSWMPSLPVGWRRLSTRRATIMSTSPLP